jgi:hypothetical protein
MEPTLKSTTPPGLLADIQKIEDRSDTWFSNLSITNFGYDAAAWGVLTQVIWLIEDAAERFGFASQEQREVMMNLGRSAALLLDRLRSTDLPNTTAWRRWTSPLAEASKAAVMAAHNYEGFVACFTMWHKNRMAAEVLSPTRLRFSSAAAPMQLRVRAYQQGARVRGWPTTADQPIDKSLVDDPAVKELMSTLWNKVTFEGALAMRYPDDHELLSVLRDIYLVRLKLVFRRNSQLDLGGYTLDNFRQFFAALMSLCSVHEHLCFAWQRAQGRYPFESAVMAKTATAWVDLIASLSGLQQNVVRTMLADLTFGATPPLDLYIHPFVASADGNELFLVPHFILSSRAEENILRVCSYAREQAYSTISNAKEEEMRRALQARAPNRFKLSGPVHLPDASLPDIDLLIEDSVDSSVLLAEMKWLRKTVRAVEHVDRDEALEDGFRQLRDVRAYLVHNPQYLHAQGLIQNLGSRLSFALIARDHLLWIEPEQNMWLTEFDALDWALQDSGTLSEAISKLQKYEWLPTEGNDFVVRFETTAVAGVAIESEVYHRKRKD